MSHSVTTLANGLRVASETLPGVESVAISFSVDVGSRHESESEGGISHLLEHMAFKGTATRTARDIAEQFDNIGGQFNAYTSVEHTVYHAKVLKEHLALAMDILSDILLNSLFDATELKREKDVVLQEIAMHHDNPDELIFDLLDQAAFPDQPLGRSILGTPERVQSYSRDDVVNYMRRHYDPSRIVFSAAGAVDHDTLLPLAEKHFTLAPAGQQRPLLEPGRYAGGDIRVSDDFEQLHLMLAFPALPVHHDSYYAMMLYSAILGGGMSSRLFQEVREKRGLAYHVSSMVSAYADCGLLSIYSATGEQHAGELPLLLIDELRKMADHVSEQELARVKNQQKAELLMLRESPGRVASWLGKHLLVYGRIRPLEEILERVEAVTVEDIRAFGAMIVSTREPTQAALGPLGSLPTPDMLASRLHG